MAQFPLALVTGGAHRLGRAFALTLARRRYALLLHYHHASALAQETAKQVQALGAPVYLFGADLTQESQIEALFAFADSLLAAPENNLEGFKALVNSAGIMRRADAKTLTALAWDETFAINLRAAFLCAQKAFPHLNPGGLIVNITDVAAQKAWASFPDYTVSKAALEALTRVLARAFAPGVRVNAIAPGLALPSDIMNTDDWNRLTERLPLQRPAALEELTAALVFLLENEYITGQSIVVDGGYSLI